MPCSSCGGRRSGPANIPNTDDKLIPTYWGPLFWNYLHCLTERIGMSGNKLIDTDESNYITTIITLLPMILPCIDCQAHCAEYLHSVPFPSLKGYYGSDLQSLVRTWLFEFHNTVRTLTNQSIIVLSADDCKLLYTGCSITKAHYSSIVECCTLAIQKGWVKLPYWHKWYSNSERLRLLTGIIV
jgi:hypothetical protein